MKQQKADVLQKIQHVLDHHAELGVEFEGERICVRLNKLRTNLLGNFPGGEIAYLANAAAGIHCIATETVAETVNLHVDFLTRAKGDTLVARCTTIKAGRTLIRVAVDVTVCSDKQEQRVAIGQVTLIRIRDTDIKSLFV